MSLISFTTRLIKCLSYSLPLIPFFHSPLNPFQEGFCPQHSNEIAHQSHQWPPHCWTRWSILSSHPPQAAFTRVNQFLILESFLCLTSGSKLFLAFSSITLTSPFFFSLLAPLCSCFLSHYSKTLLFWTCTLGCGDSCTPLELTGVIWCHSAGGWS